MHKKALKISIILTALVLSVIFPLIAVSFVSAKKPVYTSGPVYINDAVPGHSWEDWSAQPWLKGSGTEEDPYMIKDLVIDVSGSIFAMRIENSAVHFKIMHCVFRNLGIEEERTAGLILLGTTNGVVFKNDFYGSNGGLALIGTQNNLVHKNNFYENQIGIYLQWSMFDVIKQNICKDNYHSGIMLSTAHKTIIEKNLCTGNGVAGITLINEQENDPFGEHDPKDNILYKNKLEGNNIGIYLSRADINDIFHNTISGNNYGVLLDLGCENNLVYHNNFLDNIFQAIDSSGMNNWYHQYMLEGNFWSDTPLGYDAYPLMQKDGWEILTPLEQEILSATNKLGGGRTVYASQTSYITWGVMQLFSERINGAAFPPYTVRIWFYGVEKFFEGSVWAFREETNYGEPGLMQLYYRIIPPYYLLEAGLTYGYHEYEVEISWYDSGELTIIHFTTGFTLV